MPVLNPQLVPIAFNKIIIIKKELMEQIHRPPPRPHRPSLPLPPSPDLEEKGGWTERREGHREREGAGEPPPPLQPALEEKEGGGCRGGEGGRMPVERCM